MRNLIVDIIVYKVFPHIATFAKGHHCEEQTYYCECRYFRAAKFSRI